MTLYWLVTNLIAAVLLPPLSLLLLAAFGLTQLRRKPKLGRRLIGFSLLALWLLATPIVADTFLESLMPRPVMLSAAQADAIVVLGGGRYKDDIGYGGDTANAFSLERVRYGAYLARKFKKPVLVTGGAPEAARVPEGELMRQAMENEFRIPVRWVEDRSRNTLENAEFSAPMLKKAGIKRIFLVSHAWHLARAIPEFERFGFEVIPAGTGAKLNKPEYEVFDFVPNAKSLLNSYYATHEWIGLLWYRLRHYAD